MNKEEFDSKLAASRGRVKAYSDGYRKGYDAGKAAKSGIGCMTLPIIAILIILALAVMGCNNPIVCDCGWITGAINCDVDEGAGHVWAYLPNYAAVDEWQVNLIGFPFGCPDGTARTITDVSDISTVEYSDKWVFVHATVTLSAAPAATPTETE